MYLIGKKKPKNVFQLSINWSLFVKVAKFMLVWVANTNILPSLIKNVPLPSPFNHCIGLLYMVYVCESEIFLIYCCFIGATRFTHLLSDVKMNHHSCCYYTSSYVFWSKIYEKRKLIFLSLDFIFRHIEKIKIKLKCVPFRTHLKKAFSNRIIF